MTSPSDVHAVLPAGVDDPRRPSGGNTYDRHLCAGLRDLGWTVHEHHLPGTWPAPTREDLASLAAVLDTLPRDTTVLLDGLIASPSPDVLTARAERLRLVFLVHTPLGVSSPRHAAAEARALAAAVAVVTTSDWTRRWLTDHAGMPSARLHVANPGVDPADLAPAHTSPKWGDMSARLLTVGAVVPHKGLDVLLDALATLTDLPWTWAVAGSLDVAPDHVEHLRRQATAAGIADQVTLLGPLERPALDAAYADADLLVVPSRAETYGMVVTEALARGLPVVATTAGGLPEALGHTAYGEPAGLLLPPGDAPALAEALRDVLTRPDAHQALRRAAADRRGRLQGWDETAVSVARVLEGVAR